MIIGHFPNFREDEKRRNINIKVDQRSSGSENLVYYNPGRIKFEYDIERNCNKTMATTSAFHSTGSEDWPMTYQSTAGLYGPYGPSHSSILIDEFPSSTYWTSSMALVDNYDMTEEEMQTSPR